MHMADALLSPVVGGAFWALSAGAIACGSTMLRRDPNERKAPLMGVLGAFVFAAQMINFAIPGTGSSGHLGGGLLLAVLLGPAGGLLTTASVLVVQAFFFADGGLLALGCNIFNLGVIPSFIVYPLVYRTLIGQSPGRLRRASVTMLSALSALQLGALAVVLETAASGISSLPFSEFLLLMQPIHLAVGVVEGAVTAALLSFIAKARPEVGRDTVGTASCRLAPISVAVLASALLVAGGLSLSASKNPDGLEWAIAKTTGNAKFAAPSDALHHAASVLQGKTVVFPDYAFKAASKTKRPGDLDGGDAQNGIAGVAGAMVTLLLIISATFVFRKSRGRSARSS